jgi:hypothetical protein
VSEDPVPEHRKLEGNREYETALDTLFARSGRKLRIFERQLGPAYNGLERYDLLRGFLLASRARTIQIVLHDASNLQRDCPRLINLLRQYSHAVTVHETEPQAKAVYDPFAVMDDRDYVHRFHYDDSRGLLGLNDPHEARGFVQRFEELWEASAPAASGTTLGL